VLYGSMRGQALGPASLSGEGGNKVLGKGGTEASCPGPSFKGRSSVRERGGALWMIAAALLAWRDLGVKTGAHVALCQRMCLSVQADGLARCHVRGTSCHRGCSMHVCTACVHALGARTSSTLLLQLSLSSVCWTGTSYAHTQAHGMYARVFHLLACPVHCKIRPNAWAGVWDECSHRGSGPIPEPATVVSRCGANLPWC
jgi:hypothetical protein